MKRKLLLTILCSFIATIWTSELKAQKITMGYIYPAGAERGTTADILIGGLNVSKATSVIVSGKGVKAELIKLTEIELTQQNKKKKRSLGDQSSPQLADQLKIRMTIDKSAAPGLRDLRLQSTGGVSNKLYFEVGQYPDVLEVNGSKATKPNVVENLPSVLSGQIFPGEIDYFSFTAKKGTNVVAAVKGRTLIPFIADAVPGWFQPVISIRNSKGKEVAYCDDYRFNVDPVIILQVPETDMYTLEIHDAIYRGREDFNYRIELGEIPFLESIYPAAVKAGKKTEIKLNGVNLKSNKMTYLTEKEGYNSLMALGKNGALSNPVLVWGAKKSENLHVNDKTDLTISDNQVFFDTLNMENRVKQYAFNADLGETATFEITARRIGSLLDGRLRLLDETGKFLAQADDVEDDMQGLMTFHADPALTYTFKTAGRYYLQVEDVLNKSGSEYFYLLEKKKTTQPFKLFVSPATLSVARGGTSLFTVTVNSKDKINNPIVLDLKGLPAGSKLSSMRIQGGGKKKDVSVTIPENSAEGIYDLKLSAKLFDPKTKTESPNVNAVAADQMMQAFYYMHNIPAAGFSAQVTAKAPFQIEFPSNLYQNGEFQIPVSQTDSTISIPVIIKRNGDFKETIELSVYPKSKKIVMDDMKLLPNEKEKTVILSVASADFFKPKRLRYGLVIVGTVNGQVDKQGKRSFSNATHREMSPMILLVKE